MPALLVYLVAVTLLLGGGYGALNWLATPEPVKVMAKATPKAPPPHYADNSKPDSTPADPPRVNPPEPGKPEARHEPAIGENHQANAAAKDKAVSSDQPPTPQPPAAANRQEAKTEAAEPARDRSPQVEVSQAVTSEGTKPQAGASPVEATQDNPAPARHEEEKQSPQAAPQGSAQTIASIAPAAKPAKRPHVRQAGRVFEKRPLEVMTLRTIELPDGRRVNRLIPYRGSDRYRDDGSAMALGVDE